ncbi:MAG: hypothetical protein Kow0042_20310 [Calditrichia bacterium]
MKTALILGGGGARGMAHLGVLRVLEREGIVPDLIVGCSVGAVIGGMYAQNPDIDAVQNRLQAFFMSKVYDELNIEVLEKHRDIEEKKDLIHQIVRNAMKRVMLNLVVSRISIIKADKVDNVIRFLIDEGNIEDTKIQFACNATDLTHAQPVLFTEGDIRFAITASSTIPGYLPPVQHNSQILVDGAVTYTLPVKFARTLGAEFIIAVDVKSRLLPQAKFNNILDVILRANAITSSLLAEEASDVADILILPPVGDFHWYDFRKMEEIIRAGENAALLRLPEIKEGLKKSEESFWRRLFRIRRAG